MSLMKDLSLTSGRVGHRLVVAAAIVAAFGIGFAIRGGRDSAPADLGAESQTPAVPTIWTCSMHPQIKLPKPGKCPICFMDLIPLTTEVESDLGPRSLVLSEAAAALAEIQTDTVVRRNMTASVRLIGKIDYNETLFRTISAWVPGRIDTLFVDFTGALVTKGERLASLYSPVLYAAQAELRNAIEADVDLQNNADPIMRSTARATVVSARERLRLWGLPPDQIDMMAAQKEAKVHVDITAPIGGVVVHKAAVEGMYIETGSRLFTVADLSRVWAILQAYESDLAWLQEGQSVEFTVEALPGQQFSGRVFFVDPVLDARTRTAEVRIDVENRHGHLKPGMFVKAVVKSSAHSGSRALKTGLEEPPLLIPVTAALITGERAVVYVRVPNREKPTFEGREVILGPRVGDEYVVVSGLSEGETVVTRGNFKIDSALQIQAKPSMMSPEGGGTAAGHNHGAGMSQAPAAPMAAAPSTTERPVHPVGEDFRRQLGELLQSYLAIQAAMAADDDAGVVVAADRADAALAGIDMGLLEGENHAVWMTDAEVLGKAISAIAAANDIKSRRSELPAATEAVWHSLKQFGFAGTGLVRRFHCPMANDNAGADWLQTSLATANPYFGAAMSRCGAQVDSLKASTPGEGR